jgi:hypothetical protein
MLPAGHSPAFAFEAIAINPTVALCGKPHHGVDRSGLVTPSWKSAAQGNAYWLWCS